MKRLGAILFLGILTAGSLKAIPVHIERIEARVGRQIITSTDIQLEMERLQAGLSESKAEKTVKARALDELVERALIRDYLSSLQAGVSDQDVERRVNAIRSSHGASSIEEFRSMLEAQGVSFDTFRNQIRQQMEIGQFNSIVQRQTLQTIDDAEMMAYYNNHLSDFQSNFEVVLQECLVPFANDKEAILKRTKIYTTQPAKFDECVTTLSRSPSAARGGMIGSVKRGALREDVEAKVFATPAGEVATIELPAAVQYLKVVEKKDLGPQTFESVKDLIRRRIEIERLESAREKLLSDLKTATYIKVES